MKIRKRKKIKLFLMLVLVLTTAFFIQERQDTKAADDPIWIEVAGAKFGPADTYVVQDKITTVQLKTNDAVYEDDTKYEIRWLTPDDPGNAVASLSAVSGSKTLYNVTAKGVGTVTLSVQIINRVGGSIVQTTSCKLKVGFTIDRSSSAFQKALPADTQESLIMRVGDSDIDLDPIFSATGAYFESGNPDIITCDQSTGVSKAIGAGPTTIKATYSVISGGVTTKYSDTIKVFVLPKVSKDSSTGAWSQTITSYSTYNKEPLYVDAIFKDKTTQTLSDKIIWVIKQDDGADDKVIADSLGKKSDLAKLEPVNATSNEYTINAKAGKYRIEFWTVGTYTSDTNHIDVEPAVVNVTVYANLKNYNINLVMGDSFNVAEAFNLDLATFKKILSESHTSYENFINYDPATGIISTKGLKRTGVVSTFSAVVGNEQLISDLCPPTTVDKTKFTITINIIDSFSLSQSNATMYTNAEMDLIVNSSYEGGAIVWSSSNPSYATVTQNGKVKALKSTDTTDSNPDNDNVIITASMTMTDGTIKTATCLISIVNTIDNLKLSATEAYVPVGDTKTITATFTPANSTASLVWVSSDPSIVDFTVSTDKRSIVVTGKKVGTTTIIVMNEKNMIYTSCKITVSDSISAITLSQTNITVKKSQEYLRLKATTVPADAAAVLMWESSNTAVATVDDNGLVTLVSAGNAIISVKPTYNPNYVQAQCNLTVTESSSGITLSKTTTTIEVSKTEKLEYTLAPNNATSTLTWKSIDSSIASVSSTGVVTAVAPGKTYVTVTTQEGHSATCTIIVTQAATGVKLDVYDLTLGVGDVYHVIAAPVPAGSTETVLTWTAKDPGIATVTDAGKVTGVSPGSTIILIKTKSGKVEYLYVTVKENIKGMTLNYATKSVTKNRTFTLKPVFTPSKPTNTKVTWTSSNTKIASVTSAGVVKGLKGGTAIITCKSQEGGYVATCIVTVNEVMTSLKLNHSSYRLGIGKTVTLKATIKTNAATNQVLRWTSSNTSIATVNSKGKITAKKIGKCTIRVKATDGSGEQDSCTIYVVRAATSIRLNKAVVTVVEGRSVKLSATIKPSNVTYKTPTWSSSNKDVAIVDSSGRVTGFKVGVATIKAVTRDNSNKTAYCIVNVIKEVAASSVTVSTKDMTMIKGQTGTVSVSIQPSNSTDSVTYSSDNRAIATVTNKGKITARTPGIATITITTSSGKQATVNVTVVGLNKSSLTMEQYDAETIWVEGAKKVSWFSTNPSVATVDSNGKVVAKKSGTTVINAMVNGIKLTCRVRVKNISN